MPGRSDHRRRLTLCRPDEPDAAAKLRNVVGRDTSRVLLCAEQVNEVYYEKQRYPPSIITMKMSDQPTHQVFCSVRLNIQANIIIPV